MTPNEINAAIAEACGWKNFTESFKGAMCGVPPTASGLHHEMPNYYGDLNACADMEKVARLNQFHYVEYPQQLFEVITNKKWNGDLGYFTFYFITATAPQRCEAFLKTIGKWKEKA